MQPSAPVPSAPATAVPDVFFPQTFSHIAHAYSPTGELRTALITGGDRLVILRDGVQIAESRPLFSTVCSGTSGGSRRPEEGGAPWREGCRETTHEAMGTRQSGVAVHSPMIPVAAADAGKPQVQCLRLCPFASDRVRAVIATSVGLVLFEVKDSAVGQQPTFTQGRSEAPDTDDAGPRPGWAVLHGRSVAASAPVCSSSPVFQALGTGPLQSRYRLLCLTPPSVGIQTHTTSADGPSTGGGTIVKLCTRRDLVVAMEFITVHKLCVLFNDEAVIVRLAEPVEGRSPTDRIVWRSMGDYRLLAVCPVHCHIALAHDSSLVVFPGNSPQRSTPARSGGGVDDHTRDLPFGACAPRTVFSPTQQSDRAVRPFKPSRATTAAAHDDAASLRKGSFADPCDRDDAAMEEVDLGLTASLGCNQITRLEWHRMSTHTLLCVTCTHPEDGSESVVLYTVQSVPVVRRFTNVRRMDEEGVEVLSDDGVCAEVHEAERIVQLVPAGTISQSHSLEKLGGQRAADGLPCSASPTPTSSSDAVWSSRSPQVAHMHTRIVPAASRCTSVASLGNMLEFLHVGADGTVCTSSYQFGRQQSASFTKQRADGSASARLLAPLLALYGPLQRLEVLPVWKNRAVELGHNTPHAELFMTSTRRYRIVCHFGWTGVVALVMVDMKASVCRVEGFLALGALRVTSISAFTPSEMVAGRCGHLVAALLAAPPPLAGATPMAGPSSSCLPGYWGVALFSRRHTVAGETTMLLTVAPLPETTQGGDDLSTPVDRRSAAAFAAGNERESDTAADRMARVEHYIRRRCPEKARMAPALLKAVRGDAARLLTQLTLKYGPLDPGDELVVPAPPSLPVPASASLPLEYVLQGGFVTCDGVALCLRSASFSGLCGTPRQYVIVLPSVALESLSPVQSHIAFGGVEVATAAVASVMMMPSVVAPANSVDPSGTVHSTASPMSEKEVDMRRRVTALWRCCFSRPVHCDVQPGGSSIMVSGPTVGQPVRLPCDKESAVEILDVKGELLVNHDTVVGVLVQRRGGPRDGGGVAGSELRLYGRPAVQSLMVRSPADGRVEADLEFILEASLPNISAFFIGPRGEVVVLQDGCMWALWRRCFPDVAAGYDRHHYIGDSTATLPAIAASDPLGDHWTSVTAAEAISLPTPSASVEHPHRAGLLYATSGTDYLRVVRTTADVSQAMFVRGSFGDGWPRAGRDEEVAQYHPDSIMQLIGLGRWGVLQKVLTRVTEAARQHTHRTDPTPNAGVPVEADALTAILCEGLMEVGRPCAPVLYIPSLRAWGDPHRTVGATASGVLAPSPSTTVHARLTTAFGDDPLLTELVELLPRVTLRGLSSQAQLGLQCIVEALASASALSCDVDEAASRFFFLHKLRFLQQRLRFPELVLRSSATTEAERVEATTILNFSVGRTAARNVATVSYLWAALSDSQRVIVSELFGDDATAVKSVSWEEVEAAGVAFWLRDTNLLRQLAEKVARGQYQQTRDATECALMYCVARKVTLLAALCKAQNLSRLHAFFSRDFTQEVNRRAATANAFAAIGKNLPLYGATFFLLANDVENAVRTILQRHGSLSLAVLVLRTAPGRGSPADLQWFASTAVKEARQCGPLDLWHDACLSWLTESVEDRVAGLRRIAQHPSAHPECLGVLRYARESVVSVALRRDCFLSVDQETVCLMRMARYCHARGLALNRTLLLEDAATLLAALREGGETAPRAQSTDSLTRRAAASRGFAANMTADFCAGTLTFKGFGDASDDDGDPPPTATASGACAAGRAVAARSVSPVILHQGLAGALQEELDYVWRQTQQCASVAPSSAGPATPLMSVPHPTASASLRDVPPVDDVRLFAALCPLFLAVVKEAPSAELRRLLRSLIAVLAAALPGATWVPLEVSPQESLTRRATSPSPSRSSAAERLCVPHRTHDVFVALFYIILGEVAERFQHEALAHALRGAPLDSWVLTNSVRYVQPGEEPVAVKAPPIVGLLLYVLDRLERLQQEGAATMLDTSPDDHAVDTNSSSAEGDASDLRKLLSESAHQSVWDALHAAAEGEERHRAKSVGGDVRSLYTMSYEGLQAWHYRWFKVYVASQALRRLRDLAKEDVAPLSPTTQRAVDMGILSMDAETAPSDDFSRCHRFAYCLLLCCGTAYATLCFNHHSQRCYASLHEACRDSDRGRLTNANGLFVEMDRVLAGTAEVLYAVLAAAAAEVSSPVMLEPECKGGRTVLSHSFMSTPGSASRNDDVSVLVVHLCTTTSEIFWQLPTIGSEVATLGTLLQATFHAAVPHLQATTLPPTSILRIFALPCAAASAAGSTPGRRVAETPLGGDATAFCSTGRHLLRLMESSWMRRHHTHQSLRQMLFRIVTEPSLCDAPLATDRILVQQSRDSILYVGFDLSSCDSIVWSTDRGTEVAHGFREILAGDNEAVLLEQLPERNIATAALSDVLRQQQRALLFSHPTSEEAEPSHGDDLSKCSLAADPTGVGPASAFYRVTSGEVLSQRVWPHSLFAKRPLASVTAQARPVPHPHLPFYLTCQSDGRLHLYAFASSQVVASFQLVGGSATTRAVFSPDGYQFVVGMQDGAVAVWRFTAFAVNEPPLFVLPFLFHGSGVRAVCYGGERSSLVAAVGVVCEPHIPPRVLSQEATSSPTNCSFLAAPAVASAALDPTLRLLSPVGVTPGSFATASGTPAAAEAARRRPSTWKPTGVGELLIVDTAWRKGDVVVRCALPFLPDYAVYLALLDAVLCVSAEGYLAAYEMRSGRLSIIGQARLSTLLAAANPTLQASWVDTKANSSVKSSPVTRHGNASVDASGKEAVVTCVAVNSYDPIIAVGLSTGFVLVLPLSDIAGAVRDCATAFEDGRDDPFTYVTTTRANHGRKTGRKRPTHGGLYECPSCLRAGSDTVAHHRSQSPTPLPLNPVSPLLNQPESRSVLSRATLLQVAPHLTAQAAVMDVMWSPSALLAGLADGKVIATTLIPRSLRQAVTAGG